jgi:CRISPR-associated endoribonuclease Cas6
MQLLVQLLGKNISLPLANAEIVQGMLYRALSSDLAYSTALHESGSAYSGRKFKLFTFSELKGKHRIEDGRIIYYSSVNLRISSADPYFIQLVYTYLLKAKTLMLEKNEVTVGTLKLLDERITTTSARVRTLSPITVYATDENGKTIYFTPDDESFCKQIVTNAHRKYASLHSDAEDLPLKVTVLNS